MSICLAVSLEKSYIILKCPLFESTLSLYNKEYKNWTLTFSEISMIFFVHEEITHGSPVCYGFGFERVPSTKKKKKLYGHSISLIVFLCIIPYNKCPVFVFFL